MFAVCLQTTFCTLKCELPINKKKTGLHKNLSIKVFCISKLQADCREIVLHEKKFAIEKVEQSTWMMFKTPRSVRDVK